MTHEELQHIPEELRELFREYSALGWNPQLCDVLVPYYDNRVWQAMQAVGYKENTKMLTRAQVKVIVKFLDPPV